MIGMRNLLFGQWIVALLGIGMLIGQARQAQACPFCSAVSLTFAQEIAQSQAAVIVRLVEPPPSGALSPRAEGPLPKGKFAVVEVLKGADLVAEAGHSVADGTPIFFCKMFEARIAPAARDAGAVEGPADANDS